MRSFTYYVFMGLLCLTLFGCGAEVEEPGTEDPGTEEPAPEEPGINCGVDAEGNPLEGEAIIDGPDAIQAGFRGAFYPSFTSTELTLPFTYEWHQTAGPEGVMYQRTTYPNYLSFTSPLAIDTVELTLVITDSEGLCFSTKKSVSILASTLDINEPDPVYRNQELELYIAKSNLPPNARDKDVTLQLVQTSGPAVAISYDNSAYVLRTRFTVPYDFTPLEFVLYGLYEGRAFSRQAVVISPINQVPTAKINRAAYPITLTQFKHKPITLDGATSTDPDADTLTYQWTQLAGEPVEISDPSNPQLTITMPGFMDSMEFKLAVADGFGGSDDTTVTVNVLNNAPTADAGNDFVAPAGIPVFLDGGASSDEDNDTLTYIWTQLTGPTLQLTNPSSSAPGFTADQPGEGYLFKVEVYDGVDYSDNDSFVAVSIKPNTGDQDTDADSIPDHYDADADGDGLLELFTDELYDTLSRRWLNLPGCPAQGCNGYELTTDLDFDTNQDGQIGEGDDLTTLALRWRGVYMNDSAFNFEGHHHSLLNLPGNLASAFVDAPYILEPIEAKSYFVRNLNLHSLDTEWFSSGMLFNLVELSHGRTLTLENISITGDQPEGYDVGGMIRELDIRRSSQVDIINCSYRGTMRSIGSHAGGLIADTTVYSSTLNIVDSHAELTINGSNSFDGLGGLIGHVSASNGIVNILRSYSRGEIAATDSDLSGGLVGYFNAYWDDNPYAALNIIDSYSTMDVLTDSTYIGGLVGGYEGPSLNTYLSIERSYYAGHVKGRGDVGGFIGLSNSGITHISNSWTGGLVEGSPTGSTTLPSVGGLSGGLSPTGNTIHVSNSYSVSQIQYGSATGALMGFVYTDDAPSDLSVLIERSYWAQEISGQTVAVGMDETLVVDDRSTGVEFVSELACPNASDDFSCSSSVLFENWGAELDEQGQPVWNFGNSDQLPGLRLGDAIHRPQLNPDTGLYDSSI